MSKQKFNYKYRVGNAEAIRHCIGCGDSFDFYNQISPDFDVCISCNLRWALGVGEPLKLKKLDRANDEWRRRTGGKPVLNRETAFRAQKSDTCREKRLCGMK